MKVLIIYSSESREYVESIRGEIANRFGRQTILRLKSRERDNQKKLHVRHLWHRDAIRMIKLADMIVYVVSKHSADNKNVEWEIKQALAKNKYIVCLQASEEARINNSLYTYDKYQKERVCLADIVHSEEDIYTIIQNFNNDAHIKLINNEYDVNILMEQYKIFSDSAESLLTRRQNVNSFYISANTALITIGATVFALSEENNLLSRLIIVIALSLPGILLNISWLRIMKSYYINNRGKMKILSMMEKHLAASLYDAEWKAMKNRFSKERYVSFTDSEKILPLVFILFYALADIVTVAILTVLLFHIPF